MRLRDQPLMENHHPVLSIKLLVIVAIFVILQFFIIGFATSGYYAEYRDGPDEARKQQYLYAATTVATIVSTALVLTKYIMLRNKLGCSNNQPFCRGW